MVVLVLPPSVTPVGVVYGLRHVDSDEYRYVGHTTTTIRHRLQRHFGQARSGRKTPLYDWIRKVGEENIVAEMLEYVRTDREDLGIAEMAWISYLREKGNSLLNIADGGLGPAGLVWTDEQREAARLRSTGRAGVSRPGELNPFFGKRHSAQQRATWAEKRAGSITGSANPNYGKFGVDHPSYGRVLSEDAKALLAEQKRGERNPNFGKKTSDETRARMSAAQKGVPKPSSARSAHTRYHTNRGIISPKCKFCADTASSPSNPESETS